MKPRQLLHQREANAGSLMGTSLRAGHAMEAFEDLRQLVIGYADARVVHDKLEMRTSLPQGNPDPAVVGELEGIRDEIEDNLLPHLAIDESFLVQRRAFDNEPQSGLLDGRGEIHRQAPPCMPPNRSARNTARIRPASMREKSSSAFTSFSSRSPLR